MSQFMTIAEVSRLSGISAETIRHYERLGLIHPLRNDQTGYRYYTIVDICLIGKIQTFLQCGFSLKESKEMLNNMDISNMNSFFDERIRELEQQMLESFKRIHGMRRKGRQLSLIESNMGKFSLKTRPAMYLLNTYEDGKVINLPDLEEVHAAWFKRQVFTFPFERWEETGESASLHQIVQYVGLGIEKKDFADSGLEYNELMTEYPEIPCVHTVLAVRNPVETRDKILEIIDNYMMEQGLTQNGDILFETLFLSEADGQAVYYRSVWIPYKH